MKKFKRNKATYKQNITTWPKLNINYWGINKNATSTFVSHFAKLSGTIPDDYDYDLGLYAKHEAEYIDYSDALSNGRMNFAIVRNPETRFLSCFKQFKYPKNEIHEGSRDKAQFDPRWSANDFLEFIVNYYKTGKGKRNKHWVKQVEFLHCHPQIEHIVKLENIEKDWPFDFSLPEFVSNKNDSDISNTEFDIQLLKEVYNDDYKAFGYK